MKNLINNRHFLLSLRNVNRNYDFSVIEEIRVPFGLIPGYPTFGSIFVTFTDIDETCSFYYNDNNGHIRKTNCWYSHKKIE